MDEIMTRAQSIVGTSAGRDRVDFYSTPSYATEALLEMEKFEGSIWEPACGDGAMSKVLETHYPGQVTSSDLYDRGFGTTGLDFLSTITQTENVITNPPFSLGEEFVRQGLRCADKKVCLLLKLCFLEGCKRKLMFRTTPLAHVYVFSSRLTFSRAGIDLKNGGMMAFAWFVWDKSYHGQPQIDWI